MIRAIHIAVTLTEKNIRRVNLENCLYIILNYTYTYKRVRCIEAARDRYNI